MSKLNLKIFNKRSYYLTVVVLVIIYNLSWLTSSWEDDRYDFYVVNSGSMLPQLKPGFLIFTAAQDHYQTGQVVSYRQTNPTAQTQNTVTHRIVQTRTKSANDQTHETKSVEYLLRGDANRVADGWIESEQIVGRVLLSLPWLGKIVMWLQTKLGKILGVYLPIALILFIELQRLRQPNQPAQK